MRILVTGAKGFVGKNLCAQLNNIKDGKDNNTLPFILCDTMGLSEKEGLDMDDIPYILEGHFPDKYQV